jgi:hypothetical protein
LRRARDSDKWRLLHRKSAAGSALSLWYYWLMVTKRRASYNGGSSSSNRQGHASGIARPKKRAFEKGYLKASSSRTRTSLVGVTIYQPDLKPSPVGRKLLEALES